MCSNFGFNLHPIGPPCGVETQWYAWWRRLVAYLRAKFHPKALYVSPSKGKRRPFHPVGIHRQDESSK